MSRNVHSVHVYATTKRARARTLATVLAYAKAEGFERVARTVGADRVIRIGTTKRWSTIVDDGYDIPGITKALQKAELTLLEAYCEASAIVWLALYANKRRVGGWGLPLRPVARLVRPLLATGTPAELGTAWDEGIRQTFPETALAVAARRFGIAVDHMLGDREPRGTTIALRRTRAKWTPSYHIGAPSFRVGFPSNQGWGADHLVFTGEAAKYSVQITSTGGPSTGIAITLGGDAIDNGHVEIASVAHPRFALVRDGASLTWRDPAAAIPAGFVEPFDVFSLGRRESDKARELEAEREWYFAIAYRAAREGACTLTASVESGAGHGEGAVGLHVSFQPWRPKSARAGADTWALFAMHRREIAVAHITLRGTLADMWSWARPHVEAWCAAESETALRARRDSDVVLAGNLDSGALPFDAVAVHFPQPRDVPFEIAGNWFRFGTFGFRPFDMQPSDELVVQLVLAVRCRQGTEGPLSRLAAIVDDAFVRGVAFSALVSTQQTLPDERTAWETIAGRSTPELVAWHRDHIRGIDKRIWLGAEHAARIDREALTRHATLTDIGTGLRITVPDDQPRRGLAPLEELLWPLLPTGTS